jgi:predicted RNA binding protein YcfA (HicA-like mRNA interferase family)
VAALALAAVKATSATIDSVRIIRRAYQAAQAPPTGAAELLPLIEFRASRRRAVQPYVLAMKVRDAVRLLKSDGWLEVRARGSHRQFKHQLKRSCVTVPGKPSDDLAPGTFNSILKQAGLKRR